MSNYTCRACGKMKHEDVVQWRGAHVFCNDCVERHAPVRARVVLEAHNTGKTDDCPCFRHTMARRFTMAATGRTPSAHPNPSKGSPEVAVAQGKSVLLPKDAEITVCGIPITEGFAPSRPKPLRCTCGNTRLDYAADPVTCDVCTAQYRWTGSHWVIFGKIASLAIKGTITATATPRCRVCKDETTHGASACGCGKCFSCCEARRG